MTQLKDIKSNSIICFHQSIVLLCLSKNENYACFLNNNNDLILYDFKYSHLGTKKCKVLNEFEDLQSASREYDKNYLYSKHSILKAGKFYIRDLKENVICLFNPNDKELLFAQDGRCFNYINEDITMSAQYEDNDEDCKTRLFHETLNNFYAKR